MRNITISVDDEVARWVRVWAAEHELSVSRFVGQVLRERMDSEAAYEAAMRANLARAPRDLKAKGRYPRREELYDRPPLR